jgi:inhibitor of KinA
MGPVEIPVCYGGRFGPDLGAVAAWAGMDPHLVIAAHASREYRVFMLGFLPGFPYMASVDERIAMPRRDTPRTRVAAGSVGIAGPQTGVYSFDSPGGWQIIGRTPLVLFDAGHQPPALLAPGQRVRFRPVPSREFEAMRPAGGSP